MTQPSLHAAAPARRATLAILAALLLIAGLAGSGIPGLRTQPATAATCPCSIWPSTATPTTPSDPDTSAVELGVKFRSDVAGYVTAIRFYKGTGNTGTHVGNLWTTSGAKLGSATFTNETDSGWQQVRFASPIAISAGTTYVASYYAPNGRYAADSKAFATAGVDNAPLHALADGVDGANGVYRYGTGGGFPSNTWQSANYWVDVVFETTATDTTAPSLTSKAPTADSTGVPVTTAVTGTFDEAVTGAQVGLTGPSGAVVGTSSYDAATRTVSFIPSAALATSTTYTATVSGAKDAAGNAMASVTWSFTTAATSGGCPCSLWPSSATPTTASAADSNAVELGVRFRSDVSGYITALRFYKGSANTGTHVGNLWRADGTKLASATFSGETATGWQQVALSSPVAVAASTHYVASYHAPKGGYAVNSSFFTSERTSPPLRAPASSTSTPNGVYRYGGSGFPSSTYKASNYWVDVVFDTSATDTTPPRVTGTSPVDGAQSVDAASSMTATFDEAVDPATLAFNVRDSAGSAVVGTTSYDSASRTAKFVPSSALTSSATYSASVSASDTTGNAMGSPVTWSFTTAAPPAPPPASTGPVLVVTPSGTGFGRYLPEILKTEGLNAYTPAGLNALTSENLAGYDVVVLGETALTATQVTVLTDWVTGGGNLIAMRPDKQLSALLGITATTGTLVDGYLLVDTAKGPGAGITGQTMQFHGTADRYTVDTATSVATLYSNSTSATSSPAVTLRSVGTAGGQAAAFTYDLARSVVYTRQGNPAFAGVERDGLNPIRSDDMFWGSTATNGYVNLEKAAIPQADEQQRLLGNLIQEMNRDRKPLPRFWYFPRMAKAVVVATGDDHGHNGTAGRYDQYEANSTPGCSVVLWSCLRFSSYIYPSTPLPAAQARDYDAKGFETGLHPSSSCSNFTPSSLDTIYSSQLSQWQTNFSGVPSPTTNRFHCIVYSDWASQPKTELKYGMGLDTNYYYFPGSWVGDRPGFMTGSGMPMRFADLDGTVIDSWQAATQLTDESGQSYPLTPDRLLDNALGTLGYYGAFTANMHTDKATIPENDHLLASARSRGVPVIAARQMLTWLKGRDASRFTDLAWSGSTLTFGITAGAGADGLTALLPITGPGGDLTGLTSGGTAVGYTTQIIKGSSYAVFTATEGTYEATYASAPVVTTAGAFYAESASEARTSQASTHGKPQTSTVVSVPAAPVDGAEGVYVRGLRNGVTAEELRMPTTLAGPADAAAPVISDVEVLSLPDGTATVTWGTDEGADSEVRFGRNAEELFDRRSNDDRVTEHSVTLTELEPDTTYYYVVRSADGGGKAVTSRVMRFVQSAAGVADSTAPSLRVGARDDATYIASRNDGELQLASEDQADFDLPQLPSGWSTEAESGGLTVVYGGAMNVDGTRVLGRAAGRPRPLEFSATFSGTEQLAGLAAHADGPWAMFTGRDGRLYASIHDGSRRTDKQLPDSWVGSPHRFRVDWTSAGVTMFVDDTRVATGSVRGAASMRPTVRDLRSDGAPLTVFWLRQAALRNASTYDSRVLDSQQMVTWDRALWEADVPTGTSLRVSVRAGNSRAPDGSWSSWAPLSGSGSRVMSEGRFLQYRVELSTMDPAKTPVLKAIGFTHNGMLLEHEKETE